MFETMFTSIELQSKYADSNTHWGSIELRKTAYYYNNKDHGLAQNTDLRGDHHVDFQIKTNKHKLHA